jgi:hypothetical protein
LLVEEEVLRPAESAVQEAQAVEQQEELVLPSVCREEAAIRLVMCTQNSKLHGSRHRNINRRGRRRRRRRTFHSAFLRRVTITPNTVMSKDESYI